MHSILHSRFSYVFHEASLKEGVDMCRKLLEGGAPGARDCPKVSVILEQFRTRALSMFQNVLPSLNVVNFSEEGTCATCMEIEMYLKNMLKTISVRIGGHS